MSQEVRKHTESSDGLVAFGDAEQVEPVTAIALLDEDGRRRVVEAFNSTAAAYPAEKLVHELFEEQVRRTPHGVALEHSGRSLTYAELNTKANQLARYLRARGLRPDQVVGICVERCLEMVVGLLGILKAGAAYLPLDPSYPRERLQYMVNDAAPPVVLTQEKLRGIFTDCAAEIVEIDVELQKLVGSDGTNLPAREAGATADSLVYVIYTSGSTGQPKGTAMPHRAMINLIEWHRSTLPTGPIRVLQFAALSFDVAFQEVFSTLCVGGVLVLLDERVRRDARALLEFLGAHRIERLFVPPLMLQALAETLAASGTVPQSLHDVITAGEQLRISPQIVSFFERIHDCRLHNHYGPTETHVVTALQLLGRPRQWPVLPSIGRPIANSRIYILDELQQPVAIGVIGEIYIGGANVARGYLGRRRLTDERFLPDVFGNDPHARMYRTGDVARWHSDGTIQYLGRNDDQVKIRGFRIELGEIEAQLGLHEQVKEAAVLAREDIPGEKRLVAYVTARGGIVPAVESLRIHLQARLPDYMLPSAFVVMESMPVTSSGKLSRRSLPAPQRDAYEAQQYEAPRDEFEEALAGIWQELLRVDRIGRQDNFFALGGHSLMLAQMVDRLQHAGVAAEARLVFEHPRFADLAGELRKARSEADSVPPNLIPPGCEALTPQMLNLVALRAEDVERLVRAVPGGAANIQDVYPLVPLQEGVLFHHLLDRGGGDTYIVTTVLQLVSRRRLDELILAVQRVLDRHDVLRTAVLWEQLPQPVQIVYRQARLPVEEMAIEPGRDPLEQLREQMRPERQRMDIRRGPPLRIQVATCPDTSACYALLQFHHVAIDHVTFDMVTSEVVAHLEGRAGQLPPPGPYRNHVARVLAQARSRDAEAFFRGKLGDVDEPTIPFGVPDVRGDGARIAEMHEELEPELAMRVRTQARRRGMSAATLFHAAYGLVVAHASGRDDVVFGTLLLGRSQGTAGTQRILGMFINTLPLRLRLAGLTAERLIAVTHREVIELLEHEQASLAVAQRCSAVGGSAPLFTALLNYVHATPGTDSNWATATGVRALAVQERTNYPITMSIDDLGEQFALTAQTDRHIDPMRLIRYMRTALDSLIHALENTPQRAALELPILPEDEQRLLLGTFNATHAHYQHEKLLHELFEEQVGRAPDAVAVTYEGESLSYAELNRKANQLAHYLRRRGLGPDQLVGICLERSHEMVVGLLGTLKAGAAYVPLDPGYPAERIAFMLQDSRPRVLLVQQELKSLLPQTTLETIALDAQWSQIAQESGDNPDAAALGLSCRSLAYVIYTSGSTGQPKGAMNEHRGVVNRLLWMQDQYGLEASDRVLQKTPFSFDVSVWEFFWPLMSGARLIMARPQGHKDPAYLRRLIEEAGVTTLHFVPSMLQIFLEQYEPGSCSSVRHVVCSGEELSVALQNQCLQRLPDARLSNLYGPTEAAVDVTYWECQSEERGSRVPIGRPIANVRMYVLDSHRQPVPLGVAGEIYIGGIGVGRGYLHRPQLTAERFVRDPFSVDPAARLYKTGDLGRWRADGAIEYLGRNDHQVKIRGFRIELGEIEAQLLRHADIKEAVVTARQEVPGDVRLVAYVVPADPTLSPDVDALRAHVRAALPDHMVPSAFVALERLPLSPNGKLDRRALPAPDPGACVTRHYEAPQGEVEKIVAGLWQELLHVERVGRQDNFFDIGGHSLLATQLIARISAQLATEISMRALFDFPTLGQLSAQVEEQRRHHLLSVADSRGQDAGTLLELVAAMPEGQVQKLLQKLLVEARQ